MSHEKQHSDGVPFAGSRTAIERQRIRVIATKVLTNKAIRALLSDAEIAALLSRPPTKSAAQ